MENASRRTFRSDTLGDQYVRLYEGADIEMGVLTNRLEKLPLSSLSTT